MSAKQRGGAFVWVIVIVVLIAAGGVWLWQGRSTAQAGDVAVTWKTRQEKLRISVIESGQLKASKSTDIYCEVKGGATILYLIPEGTQVKADDLLVRLDASTLENDLTAQRIKWEQANAAYIQAEKTKEIQISLNASTEQKATVDKAIAELDLNKYLKGDYQLKIDQAKSDVTLAEAAEKNAKQKLDDTEELYKLEFAAKLDLDGDALAHKAAEIKLTMAKESQDVLEKFEKDRQTKQLQSTVDQTNAELDRVKLRAVADMAQKEADLHSKQATLDLEKNKLDDLEEQLKNTIIRAPNAGLVVYPGNQGGMGGMGRSDRDRVEEGATVREHQLLISLPDTSEMTVVVSVHESSIDKIRIGQPAEVGIDAIGDKSFLGKVTFIAPLPDSQNQWLNPDLKIYRCEITLGGDTSVLRPGMSASTEIVIDEIQDAIAVPLHAVRRRGDHYYCYVEGAEGKPEIQEVKIGLHNDQHVAVTEGLRNGQTVFLAEPAGAPQPKFADSTEAAKTSVDELRKRTSDINARPKSDESKRNEGRTARGTPPGMTAEQLEKWNKMSPEEKKKAREEMMKNLTPEQRAQMEEARKRFGGGDGKGGDGKADGKGGPKSDAPADAKPGEKTSEKPAGKPAGKPAEPAAAPAAPAQGGGR
ncbi:MAG TPA: efflux RND transporter periplasmic adaptor subunit [Planctomycetota bacterium]|jgi:HlyD family secretion protein|nr:efflux RND transporter periplasmic adaptor subunit [Planctomycetota bacterium]